MNHRRRSTGNWEPSAKGGLDMRCDLSQSGGGPFEERREIPRESSAILRFDSDEGTQFPNESRGKQRDSRLARSAGHGGQEVPGQGSNKFPEFPSLDDTTLTISVIEGPSKGLTYELNKLCITMGRIGGGADFEFDEPEASDVHCVIAARQDGVRLYVAPSVNNICVNDQRIYTVKLAHMSTFRVGSSLLLLRVVPAQCSDIG